MSGYRPLTDSVFAALPGIFRACGTTEFPAPRRKSSHSEGDEAAIAGESLEYSQCNPGPAIPVISGRQPSQHAKTPIHGTVYDDSRDYSGEEPLAYLPQLPELAWIH